MMDIGYIQQINNDMASKAMHLGTEPAELPFPTVIEDLRSIPHLGDYVPDGWDLVDTHFVDSSGHGEEGEAALTFRQFVDIVGTASTNSDPGVGWAIVSAGQFQVYIGQFSKVTA